MAVSRQQSEQNVSLECRSLEKRPPLFLKGITCGDSPNATGCDCPMNLFVANVPRHRSAFLSRAPTKENL